jgi:hypothetical protein
MRPQIPLGNYVSPTKDPRNAGAPTENENVDWMVGTRGIDMALKKDAPSPRDVQRAGRVLSLPILGGLHHRYVEFKFSTRTAFYAVSRFQWSNIGATTDQDFCPKSASILTTFT